jgi:hypothetical protein
MKLYKVISIMCLLVMSQAIYAQNVWTGKKKVSSVQVINDGGFMIYFDSEISSTCSHSGTSSLLVYSGQGGVTDAGIKSLLSTALAAFTAGKNLNVMYDNSTSYCWGTYISISN